MTVTFPDVELVLTQYVRAHAILPAGVVVATSYEGFSQGQSRVVMTRAGGGTATRHRIDRARLDVEVLAASKFQAALIAQVVRGVLADAPGHIADGAVVTNTQEESGPAYIEDPASDTPRYVMSWLCDVRPDP